MLEGFLKNYIENHLENVDDFEYDSKYGSILSFGDDGLSVIVEPHEEEVWIHCALRDIPLKNRENFYESLLVSQMFGELTRGNHFSLDLNNGKVLLCKNFSLKDITQEQFDQQLDRFWEACLLWLATLDRLNV